ncbi:MAG: hypothetical protein HY300_15535 [Verrucomicrobia bacterium]|nr:hypothetical protein [Verrucomicrobiota bacterium]
MKLIRRLHLYLGCFFAPMLLFYILTGWYQTVVLNRIKDPSEAETLVQKFRVVHVYQVYPTDTEVKKPSSPKLYQALVVVMAVAATATILLGVVLAFRTLKPQWPVWLSLTLGIGVPALVLWLGHQR